jgi:hypothetical protein
MSRWTRFRDKAVSRVKDEFETIKKAEVHRLKQSSTYAGVTGLVASASATTQLDSSEYWITLVTSAISLYFIYRQKKQS